MSGKDPLNDDAFGQKPAKDKKPVPGAAAQHSGDTRGPAPIQHSGDTRNPT